MSRLNVDQKTIEALFADKKASFLIPDYQRPYAWGDDECLTLWDDIFTFAFPNDDRNEFNPDDEYFLGAVVTYRNDCQQLEVIDGQQRLTTLMLLLRAFYSRFGNMADSESKSTRARIEKCIWKTDEFGKANLDELKIDSEVATDDDKDEFLRILRTGIVSASDKSSYASNYRFFESQIDSFLKSYPSYFAYFPVRILSNCILLPIEAESQDTALRIFSTLNDRGLPLSDADIFKAQFYKYYGPLGRKDEFIDDWKQLEAITSQIFHPIVGTPMDDLFTRYMYYLRAREGTTNTTVDSLRRFYERDKYSYLKDDRSLTELRLLAEFWQRVTDQDTDTFSPGALRQLYVLDHAPNGMWEYLVSVYFLAKQTDGVLEDAPLCTFLDKITAFIFTYTVTNPGVNALRAPVFAEMVNIVEGRDVTFSRWLFDEGLTRAQFENFVFTNQRAITRSLLTWRMLSYEDQILPSLAEPFDIEHIYARKRYELEGGLSSERDLDKLGNKVLLERSINIRASDYRFDDKKRIYSGETRRGKNKNPTVNAEIMSEIITLPTFDNKALDDRDRDILDSYFAFLRSNGLIQPARGQSA